MPYYGSSNKDLNDELLGELINYSLNEIEQREGDKGSARILKSKILTDIANRILTEVENNENKKD